MSDRNKNIISFITDLFRYHRDELSGLERNTFERELQKDPFSEEAAEGFASISERDALKDITNLQKRLRTRTNRGKKVIVNRIAASVAILMMISSLFIYIEKDKATKQLAYNSVQTQKNEVTLSQPAAESTKKDINPEKAIKITEQKTARSGAGKANPVSPNKSVSLGKPIEAEIQKNDSIPAKVSESAQFLITDERRSAPAMALKEDRSLSSFRAKGKILSSEDNMPIPGASVFIKGTKTGVITDTDGNFSLNLPDSINKTLVADFIGMDKKEFKVKPGQQSEIKLDPSVYGLSEVIVTGYGVKRADSDNEDVSSDHTAPQPIGGKSEFDKYIQKNLHRPDSLTSAQKVVVVLSFLVRKDGSIDSIRIVRSPGRSYSDEAIRVLKTGPSWKAAEAGGKPVDEDVRLRVVFR